MALGMVEKNPRMQEMLDRMPKSASPELMERVHFYAHKLVHAQSLDHQKGIMGKPGCNAEKVRDEIFAECKRDPAFRKAWEDVTGYMHKVYEEMRNESPLVSERGRKKKDTFSLHTAEHFKELIKSMDMKDGAKS